MKRAAPKRSRSKRTSATDGPWVPANDALARGVKRVGSAELALYDIGRGLSAGDLRGMYRGMVRASAGEWQHVQKTPPKEFWEGVTFGELDGRVRCGSASFMRGRLYIFVHGDDLDKLWPPRPSAKQAEQKQTRRRAMRHPWFPICGEIARRCVDPKTHTVKVPKVQGKFVGEMLTWCGDQGLEEPARSDMYEAVAEIFKALRKV